MKEKDREREGGSEGKRDGGSKVGGVFRVFRVTIWLCNGKVPNIVFARDFFSLFIPATVFFAVFPTLTILSLA